MSANRFERKVYTMWGNENAIFAHDEILYNSEQVVIIKFRMFLTDSLFNDVEAYSPSISYLNNIKFENIWLYN